MRTKIETIEIINFSGSAEIKYYIIVAFRHCHIAAVMEITHSTTGIKKEFADL